MKLIDCLNFSKVVSITESGVRNLAIANGKKKCKRQSTLDSGLA